MSTICVTMIYIYIYKYNSRTNPGNRYQDICRGTSVTRPVKMIKNGI